MGSQEKIYFIKTSECCYEFTNARGFPYAVSNSRSLTTCATKIYHSYQTDVFLSNRLTVKSYFIQLYSQIAGFWPKVLGSIGKLKLALISTRRVRRIRFSWPPAKCQHVVSMYVFLGQNNDCREKPLKKCFHFLWLYLVDLMANVNMHLAKICFSGKTTLDGKKPFRVSCVLFTDHDNTKFGVLTWQTSLGHHACCRDKIAELQMNL